MTHCKLCNSCSSCSNSNKSLYKKGCDGIHYPQVTTKKGCDGIYYGICSCRDNSKGGCCDGRNGCCGSSSRNGCCG